MATSGVTDFSLTIADAIDEAFRRIQVDVSKLKAEDLLSARMSLDLLFIHWQNRLPFQWKINEEVVALAAGDASYTLDADVIDVVCATTRMDNLDYPVMPMSRSDYQNIYDKTIDAERPTRFFLDKQTAAPIIYVFPVTDSNSVTLRLSVLREIETTGAVRYTPDVAKHFYPAMCAGLAWMLSEKYSPEQYTLKASIAEEMLTKALSRDSEKADVVIRPVLSRRWRR